MTEPKWQTLEGVETPFQVHVYRTGSGEPRISQSRRSPTGSPVTIVRVVSDPYGRRVGVVEDIPLERVPLGGPGTEMWVAK